MPGEKLTLSKPIQEVITELDKIFVRDGLIVPVSQKEVDSIVRIELRYYCHHKGIYGIVTHELLALLKEHIGANAIEIGSGNGTLGLGLKIPATDNKMQDDPVIAQSYAIMGQPVINYPNFVEKLDAIDAIQKHKPDTVIGSWITHKWRENEAWRGGNQWAPDEEGIMALCERYILIGNQAVHSRNRLFNAKKYNSEFIMTDCIRSRASVPLVDFIVIFTK
jgi:hypothetical protein